MRRSLILSFLLSLVLVVSCQTSGPSIKPEGLTVDYVSSRIISVSFSADIPTGYFSKCSVGLLISRSNPVSSPELEYEIDPHINEYTYSYDIYGLEPETIYKICAYVERGERQYSSIVVAATLSDSDVSAPMVGIASTPDNLTSIAFDIEGTIKATGGDEVTSYGHCWNTTGSPTIKDERTDFGKTTTPTTFKSTIEGLMSTTKYYVRSYAVNREGVSYSNSICVTTPKDVDDIWDGSIATSFDGGSGTAGDPYRIKNGGQLLLLKKKSEYGKYYELDGNINLNNMDWTPFELKGTLDGQGYVVSNLYISSSSSDNVGLFSSLGTSSSKYTTVKNLTIKGVKIDCSACSNVGSLAGKATDCLVTNINVEFLDDSYVRGKDYVGGVIGYCELHPFGSSNSELSNLHVSSSSTSAAIRGNDYVGGIVGYYKSSSSSYYVSLIECGADISIKAASNIGGIVGYCKDYVKITSCKANSSLSGESNIGGLAGNLYSASAKVIASYSSGSISATNSSSCSGLVGYCPPYSGTASFCYSTMECGLNSAMSYSECYTTSSTAPSSGVTKNCTDISSTMKKAYSDYADYFDFGNTWTWTGKVGGKTVNVTCPKLSWE